MAQFDLYKNIGKNTEQITYLLDIQHDILSELTTRVIIPLGLNKPYNKTIHPKLKVENEEVIMLTTRIATIQKHDLGQKICNIEDQRSEILNALDFLISGF